MTTNDKIFGVELGKIEEKDQKRYVDVEKELQKLLRKGTIFYNSKDDNYYLTEEGWDELPEDAKYGTTYKEYKEQLRLP